MIIASFIHGRIVSRPFLHLLLMIAKRMQTHKHFIERRSKIHAGFLNDKIFNGNRLILRLRSIEIFNVSNGRKKAVKIFAMTVKSLKL